MNRMNLSKRPTLVRRAIALLGFTITVALAAGLGLRAIASDRSASAAELIPAMQGDRELSVERSGIRVTVTDYYRQDESFVVDVCYDTLDSGDWNIWLPEVSLRYGQHEVNDNLVSEGLFLREIPAVGGMKGMRCNRVTFVETPDSTAAPEFVFTINKIGPEPREGDACGSYGELVQGEMDRRGLDIQIGCITEPGMSGLVAETIPPGMSREEVERIIHSDEFFNITGPWVFTLRP